MDDSRYITDICAIVLSNFPVCDHSNNLRLTTMYSIVVLIMNISHIMRPDRQSVKIYSFIDKVFFL